MASSGDVVNLGHGAVPPPRPGGSPVELVGTAPTFRKAIERLPEIARSGKPVLISGETGTGKELVASVIHALSPRSSLPFVPVNCGLLDQLLEDELFGHKRGAFTDARGPRLGFLAQADKGTLFLDEVDTLPHHAQVALLRVLQDGKFRPLGADDLRRVDVRLIAATNIPIETLRGNGVFRQDLFYRLAVVIVRLPPLRERREDILLLARHFLVQHKPQDRPALTFRLTPEAEQALRSHYWPGNVRELESAIIHGVTFSRGDEVGVQDLELLGTEGNSLDTPRDALSFNEWKRRCVEKDEREYLIALLREHRGNVTHAARSAGNDRRVLGRMLKKHGIDPKDFKGLS